MDRVYAVRGALAMAHETGDGAAALKALGDAYALVDLIPDAQLLYVGGGEEHASFVLPNTARQIIVRYACRCKECTGHIAQGEVAYFDTSDRTIFCARCSVRELTGSKP